MSSKPASPRLNVFALPTRTTLLFALIIAVIALLVSASLTTRLPICPPFLVIGMIIFPLYAFLRRPAIELEECKKERVEERFPLLAERWNQLAANVVGTKAPHLVLTTRDPVEPYTFGTLSRRYTAISESMAQEIEFLLHSPRVDVQQQADAVLLHELSHFRHRDVWMATFSSTLLRVTIVFMLVNFYSTSLTPLLYGSLVSLFDFKTLLPPEFIGLISAIDPDTTKIVLEQPRITAMMRFRFQIAVISLHAPIVTSCFILLVLYWRALVRTRELYADAHVVQWQGSALPLRAAFGIIQTVRVVLPQGKFSQKSSAWGAVKQKLSLGLRDFSGWLRMHPTTKMRNEVLRDPYKIYGSDAAIVLSAGGAVIMINLMLWSSLSYGYTSNPNSLVPFTLGFLVLSLSFLPFLCQFPQRHREYFSKICRTVAAFTAIKLVPQSFVAGVYVIATLIGTSVMSDSVLGAFLNMQDIASLFETTPEFIERVIVRPLFLFAIVMPIVLIGFLALDAAIKRCMLRWYSARFIVKRPSMSFLAVSLSLGAFMALFLVPILDAMTDPVENNLSTPLALCGMSLAVLALITASVWYLVWNRRYAGYCPRCGAQNKGEFWLGRSCASCGELFHPQLCANGAIIVGLALGEKAPAQ